MDCRHEQVCHAVADCPSGSQCTIATTDTAESGSANSSYTLKTMVESTQQRNFDHIFVSIPIYIGTEKEEFELIERLKTACLQSERNICTETMGKARGDVRTCLMGLLVNLLWSSVQQELKKCFF